MVRGRLCPHLAGKFDVTVDQRHVVANKREELEHMDHFWGQIELDLDAGLDGQLREVKDLVPKHLGFADLKRATPSRLVRVILVGTW